MYGRSAAHTIALTIVQIANVVGQIPALRRMPVPANRSQAKAKSWARPASPICCPYPATRPHHCTKKLLKPADEKAFEEISRAIGVMVVGSTLSSALYPASVLQHHDKAMPGIIWQRLEVTNRWVGTDSARGKKKYGRRTTVATGLDLGV